MVPPQGKPEAARLVGRYTIGDRLAARLLHAQASRAVDQVILDTAAGYRADDETIVANSQHRTFGPRRTPPGLDDRDQQDLPSFLNPRRTALQDIQIDAIHDYLLPWSVCPSTLQNRTPPRMYNHTMIATMSTSATYLTHLAPENVLAPGVATLGAGTSPGTAAGVNCALNLAKKSSAIFAAAPSISREPICASLPPTCALAT
jgi:hypothetical protein